jgi:PncC family amidohydrolase
MSLEGEVGRRLAARGRTLAVAESCTGGGLSQRITTVAGCSAYFLGGVIAYANAAKVRLLGVDRRTLAMHGAVSAHVAREMAAGARRRYGADFALSVTGVAGPTGGTARKPVGLVFVGLASASGVEARRFRFAGGRNAVRRSAATAALELLAKRMEAAAPGGRRCG